MIEIVRDVICQVRDQQFEQAFKACLEAEDYEKLAALIRDANQIRALL